MRTRQIIVALVLVLTLGLHWAALQSLAWASMIVRYSQQQTLAVAISKTFDGEHPCGLCKIIQTARAGEPDQPARLVPKPMLCDWLCDLPGPVLVSERRAGPEFSPLSRLTGEHSLQPPTPPPRLPSGA